MGTSFLVIVDAHSKWPDVLEMPCTSAAKTITALRKLFASYGLPEQVVSDNGHLREFHLFVKNYGIKHIRCAPYHPSSNGAVERFNHTFKQALKASAEDGKTLSHRLADFLLTHRSTVLTRHPVPYFYRLKFALISPYYTPMSQKGSLTSKPTKLPNMINIPSYTVFKMAYVSWYVVSTQQTLNGFLEL